MLPVKEVMPKRGGPPQNAFADRVVELADAQNEREKKMHGLMDACQKIGLSRYVNTAERVPPRFMVLGDSWEDEAWTHEGDGMKAIAFMDNAWRTGVWDVEEWDRIGFKEKRTPHEFWLVVTHDGFYTMRFDKEQMTDSISPTGRKRQIWMDIIDHHLDPNDLPPAYMVETTSGRETRIIRFAHVSKEDSIWTANFYLEVVEEDELNEVLDKARVGRSNMDVFIAREEQLIRMADVAGTVVDEIITAHAPSSPTGQLVEPQLEGTAEDASLENALDVIEGPPDGGVSTEEQPAPMLPEMQPSLHADAIVVEPVLSNQDAKTIARDYSANKTKLEHLLQDAYVEFARVLEPEIEYSRQEAVISVRNYEEYLTLKAWLAAGSTSVLDPKVVSSLSLGGVSGEGLRTAVDTSVKKMERKWGARLSKAESIYNGYEMKKRHFDGIQALRNRLNRLNVDYQKAQAVLAQTSPKKQ